MSIFSIGASFWLTAEAESKSILLAYYHELAKKLPVSIMSNLPIACQMTALTIDQRNRRSQIAKRLLESVNLVNELENGYAFRYPFETSIWMDIAEFVELERRCCPFFTFLIELKSESKSIWFHLTGPEGVKDFLKAHDDFAA